MLVAVVAAASRVRVHSSAMSQAKSSSVDDWRRTDDGWERMRGWNVHVSAPDPPLHPLVLALLQLFVSLLALVAYPEAQRKPTKQ